jgi:hypothetical protein
MVQALLTRPVRELTEAWNPSSRSMGFLRSAWEKVGGYPEELPTAEDTVFCERLREAGYDFALAPEAAVSWWPRSTYPRFFLQYARYAYGDGLSRTSAPHYRLKTLFYSLVVLGIACSLPAATSVTGPLRLVIPLLTLGVLTLYHLRHGIRMIRRGAGVLALLYEPVLMTSYDLAEIAGYLWGSLRRRSGRSR